MAEQGSPTGLSRRFNDLWERAAPPAAAAESGRVFGLLSERYLESHRHYHDLTHIAHCLGELDRARALVPQKDAVEMALWFHDVVYEPGSKTNEKDSSDLFLRGPGAFLPPPFAAKVSALVVVTAFGKVPRNEDERYMVDIDLSSFGLPWEEFLRDSLNVRRERGEVADADFYKGHRPFLESLLARPSIFSTAFFQGLYEQAARANIRRFLADLAANGYG
jgi:predicted metal-dependent HD superfamily phosphohydrolase